MTLLDACKVSPTRSAQRIHTGRKGESITIVSGPTPGRGLAYPPELAAAAATAENDRIDLPLSRPATPEECMGHTDWQPMGVPLAGVAQTPPPPLCTNCMREGVAMTMTCAGCGTQGCVHCIRSRWRECDDCLVANGHGSVR